MSGWRGWHIGLQSDSSGLLHTAGRGRLGPAWGSNSRHHIEGNRSLQQALLYCHSDQVDNLYLKLILGDSIFQVGRYYLCCHLLELICWPQIHKSSPVYIRRWEWSSQMSRRRTLQCMACTHLEISVTYDNIQGDQGEGLHVPGMLPGGMYQTPTHKDSSAQGWDKDVCPWCLPSITLAVQNKVKPDNRHSGSSNYL